MFYYASQSTCYKIRVDIVKTKTIKMLTIDEDEVEPIEPSSTWTVYVCVASSLLLVFVTNVPEA